MKRSDGRLEEAALSRVLSPYRESALTVLKFADASRRAVVIVGYDYPDVPLEVLIDDFELLARRRVRLGVRCSAPFRAPEAPNHSLHQHGSIVGWEVFGSTNG